MIPFQWPVPENMEVVTRSGEKVTQLTMFKLSTMAILSGVINDMIRVWDVTGILNDSLENGNYDLSLRPIPRERWIVMAGGNREYIYGPFTTEEAAVTYAKNYLPNFSIHKITLP